MFSHSAAFTHRCLSTNRHFYTQTLLHTEAFAQRSFCTEQLLHKEVFLPSPFKKGKQVFEFVFVCFLISCRFQQSINGMLSSLSAFAECTMWVWLTQLASAFQQPKKRLMFELLFLITYLRVPFPKLPLSISRLEYSIRVMPHCGSIWINPLCHQGRKKQYTNDLSFDVVGHRDHDHGRRLRCGFYYGFRHLGAKGPLGNDVLYWICLQHIFTICLKTYTYIHIVIFSVVYNITY